jgi:hypothetical protein
MAYAPGSGIWSQTLDRDKYGFTAPVVGQRDEATGVSLFFVQSVRFLDRYYIVCQRADGTWHFSGDPKLADKYIGKAQALAATSVPTAAQLVIA